MALNCLNYMQLEDIHIQYNCMQRQGIDTRYIKYIPFKSKSIVFNAYFYVYSIVFYFALFLSFLPCQKQRVSCGLILTKASNTINCRHSISTVKTSGNTSNLKGHLSRYYYNLKRSPTSSLILTSLSLKLGSLKILVSSQETI